MKKSEVIIDLEKIITRFEDIQKSASVRNHQHDICEIIRLIKTLDGKLNIKIAFSITGRDKLLIPDKKCRFCGNPK